MYPRGKSKANYPVSYIVWVLCCLRLRAAINTMKRLDQAHLPPKLEVPDWHVQGIEPGPPRWEASTLEKSHSNSLLIAIRNIYILAQDMAPPSACVTRTYINIHELQQDVGRIELVRQMAWCLADALQVHVFRIKSGSLLWRDLTKVISILN